MRSQIGDPGRDGPQRRQRVAPFAARREGDDDEHTRAEAPAGARAHRM
jgi:hypothetical protein